jgi:hypothetical protein
MQPRTRPSGGRSLTFARPFSVCTRRDIIFERYEGMNHDEDAVWRAPSGALVAWFKDPDGNTLSFTQFQ